MPNKCMQNVTKIVEDINNISLLLRIALFKQDVYPYPVRWYISSSTFPPCYPMKCTNLAGHFT